MTEIWANVRKMSAKRPIVRLAGRWLARNASNGALTVKSGPLESKWTNQSQQSLLANGRTKTLGVPPNTNALLARRAAVSRPWVSRPAPVNAR